MDVHFFMDPLGYYSSKFAERVLKVSPNSVIININIPEKKNEHIISFDGYNRDLKKWIDGKKIQKVYFHFYNPTFYLILKKLKKHNENLISYWFFWSAEFYNLPEIKDNQYLSFSKKYSSKNYSKPSKIKDLIKNVINKFDEKLYIHKEFIKSFNEIDYFVSTFELDFKNIQKYSKSNFEYKYFVYLSLEQVIENFSEVNFQNDEKTIMIGNSSNPSLNHYEVIELLTNYNIKNKIFIPLSYGDLKYKSYLLESISKFNLNIEVLNDFSDLNEYNCILSKVSFAFFNCPNQIAFGNIISLIWYGAKIYLHKNSSVYHELKKWGLKIFTMDQVFDNGILTPLSYDEKNSNREILKKHLSEEVVTNIYKNVLT